MAEQKENRTKRITLAVTEEEKDAVEIVAEVLRTDASNLLRDHSIKWVLEEADRIKKVAK